MEEGEILSVSGRDPHADQVLGILAIQIVANGAWIPQFQSHGKAEDRGHGSSLVPKPVFWCRCETASAIIHGERSLIYTEYYNHVWTLEMVSRKIPSFDRASPGILNCCLSVLC